MTIRDLAQLAKVAPVTVSMALRDHPRISLKTREKIQRLARKHHYRVDGKVTELMHTIRVHSTANPRGCLGLISLYPEEKPWELPLHESLQALVEGITGRALELGYRVEPFWVKQPGMGPGRLREILHARGIEGLLCAGSSVIEETPPPELDSFTVVTAGVSIPTPMHRVVTDCAKDISLIMEELKARGYLRPAFIVEEEADQRTGHLVSAMYLYYSQFAFDGLDIPIFMVLRGRLDLVALRLWLRRHRPDVIVECVHGARPDWRAFIAAEGMRVPEDIGLVTVYGADSLSELSGIALHNEILGRRQVELLVGCLQQRNIGRPKFPVLQLVPGEWIEGRTIRPRVDHPSSPATEAPPRRLPSRSSRSPSRPTA